LVDVFEEVEEQLRADRYRQMLVKGWPWALGLLVLVLAIWGGIWGWGKYQDAEAAKASTRYVQALEALSKGDSATAEKAFADVAASGSKGYRSLGLMQQAGLKITSGDTKAAVELFDKAAASATSPIIADVAKLKAAYVLLDTAPLAEIEKRLSPLADPKRPFYLLAKEALATARLMAGKTKEAKADFTVIANSLDVTPGMRDRALAANLMIDSGQTGALPALVKQAAARPELPVVPQVIPPAPAEAGAAPGNVQ
jgi:hypothetical protein